MATIDSREIIDRIIANDGYYELPPTSGEPRAVKVVRYTNAWDGTTYGVVFTGDPLDKYQETPFVRNPTVIWEVS